MPRGAKGKKKAEKAKPAAKKPLGVWVWAQCDNAGCQKWRKLPPGTVVDDNEPWFCYMNPSEDRNDCNIPEEEYNAATEAAIYSHPVSDDEAPSHDKDKLWIPANGPAQQPHRSKGAVLNGRSHKKASSSLEADERPYKQPRNGLLQPREGSDSLAAFTSGEAAEGPDADWSKQEPAADLAQGRQSGASSPAWGIRKARRAHSGFTKLLAVGGAWEVTKGRGRAAVPPPTWLWEGLAAHAPDGAQLACEAADASSAARYFEMVQAPNGPDQARETASTARLALTAAAALAVQETREIPGIDDSPTPSGGSDVAAADPPPMRIHWDEAQPPVQTPQQQAPGHDLGATGTLPTSWQRSLPGTFMQPQPGLNAGHDVNIPSSTNSQPASVPASNLPAHLLPLHQAGMSHQSGWPPAFGAGVYAATYPHAQLAYSQAGFMSQPQGFMGHVQGLIGQPQGFEGPPIMPMTAWPKPALTNSAEIAASASNLIPQQRSQTPASQKLTRGD